MKQLLVSAMLAAVITGSISTIVLARGGSALGGGQSLGTTLVEIERNERAAKQNGVSSTFKGIFRSDKAKKTKETK